MQNTSDRISLCLVALLSGFVVPTVQALGDGHETSVSREAGLLKYDSLLIDSFYQARRFDNPAEPNWEHKVLGVKGESGLAGSSANTEFEYAISLSENENHHELERDTAYFYRMRLSNNWREIDYAMKVFSVAEEFAQTQLARSRLQSANLPQAGDGAELSAGWQTLGLKVSPAFSRVVRTHEGGQRTIDRRSLDLKRRLTSGIVMSWQYASHSRFLESDERNIQLETAEGSTSTVRLAAANWNVFLNEVSARQNNDGTWHDESRVEMGGKLRIYDHFTIAPYYTATSTDSDTVGQGEQLAHLKMSAAWSSLNLRLEYRERLGLNEAQGLGAWLEVNKPLRLTDNHPPELTLSSSVAYRVSQTQDVPLWDDGYRVTLELNYRPL